MIASLCTVTPWLVCILQVAFDPEPTLFPVQSPALLRERFGWAHAILLSRGHGLDSPAVIPFMDMQNHAQSAAGHLAML